MINTTTYGSASAPAPWSVLGARHREVRTMVPDAALMTGGVRLQPVGDPAGVRATTVTVQGDESALTWRPPD